MATPDSKYRERCPNCGGALLSEPAGAPLRCTQCNWRLISRDKWLELSPFSQGYVSYMQGEWPTSELKDAKNPYAPGTPKHEEFSRGGWSAMLNVQDGEE